MILDIEPFVMVAILAAAFLTGVLHGTIGMAGGILMASILSHFVGIKAAVPAMTVALVFSHFSRVIIYFRETSWPVAGRVLLFGIPTIVLGAVIFGFISPQVIAVIFALFLILSFPIKYWAKRRQLTTGPKLLAAASMIWGMLAGNVIGPGFFLAPFLLGTGMGRLTFVGTLAAITLVMNLVKVAVFGTTELLGLELFLLGVFIGLATVPGNWLGKSILKRMQDSDHARIVDALTVLMILNFFYLAVRPAV
ncbi:MAG: sulfite exporter TauE/SafE family protein [Pseudomonadota bacterium]